MKTSWARHGFFNTLEHLLSRGLDAFATIALLWYLPTETFSLLALSQAFVAPFLFFFVSPETVLYPKFFIWQSEGLSRLSRRLRIFRWFAWGKLAVALALSAAIAFTVNPPNGTQFGFADRFFSLVWAFSLPLASQVTGPDREYLRLSLDLRALNLLTLFQRASYLAGLFLAVTFFEDLFAALAVASLLSLILNAGACRWHVEKRLTAGHSETTMIRFWPTIFDSLQNFSIWNHIAGVITGWVQTLDLFFLGVFGIPAREIGTYSVILKISNFALAVPSALANLYLVRLGRMPPPSTEKQGSEIRQLVRLSGYLGAAAMFGGLVLWVIAPWGLAYLSNGRWHLDEQIRMIGWFKSIIAASVIYASILLWTGWLSIRHSYRSLVLQVYIPWGGLSCGIYAITAFKGGANWTASANILVVMLLAVLLIRFSRLRS